MEIGIFSKYSEVEEVKSILGPELILDGGFDNNSAWSKGVGWSVAGGVGVASNVPVYESLLPIGVIPVINKIYKISFEVVSITHGSFYFYLGNFKISCSVVGVYTGVLKCENSYWGFGGDGTLTGVVDNLSIREVFGDFNSNMVGDPVEFLG